MGVKGTPPVLTPNEKSHSTKIGKYFTYCANSLLLWRGKKPGREIREAFSKDLILQIINNCCNTEVIGTSRGSDCAMYKLKLAKK